MREKIQQLNHLAEVLYNESRNRDEISKGRAQLLQDILDEIQERLDSIVNEIIAAEQVTKQPAPFSFIGYGGYITFCKPFRQAIYPKGDTTISQAQF